ncbi:MAG TPA: cupin domain-containing protein [Flavisolibacter sp.]
MGCADATPRLIHYFEAGAIIMTIEKINLRQKFAQIPDLWNPRIAGELNGQQVRLARLHGSFIWHSHAEEDEMFLVISGTLHMELRDRTIEVHEGEFIIIPKGVEHRPVAPEEVHLVLFEPASTLNTGNIEDERTRHQLDRI